MRKTYYRLPGFHFQVDASIVELILAGLSSMDLGRWHAFQCYLRSLNGSVQEDSVHVHCVTCNSEGVLWPNLKEVYNTAFFFIPFYPEE